MKQTSIEGLAVGVNALQNFDHDDLLSEINIPVLTMAGEFDGAMPTIMEKKWRLEFRARNMPQLRMLGIFQT